MANANGTQAKLTKEDRTVLTNGLDMLETSLRRSAKAAKGQSIADAFEAEARKVQALTARINTGELDL